MQDSPRQGSKVILFAGTGRMIGRTAMISSMALALGCSGARVLIVDSDDSVANLKIHHYLWLFLSDQLVSARGWYGLLTDRLSRIPEDRTKEPTLADYAQSVKTRDIPSGKIDILPVGEVDLGAVPPLTRGIDRALLRQIVNEWRLEYDYILIDGTTDRSGIVVLSDIGVDILVPCFRYEHRAINAT